MIILTPELAEFLRNQGLADKYMSLDPASIATANERWTELAIAGVDCARYSRLIEDNNLKFNFFTKKLPIHSLEVMVLAYRRGLISQVLKDDNILQEGGLELFRNILATIPEEDKRLSGAAFACFGRYGDSLVYNNRRITRYNRDGSMYQAGVIYALVALKILKPYYLKMVEAGMSRFVTSVIMGKYGQPANSELAPFNDLDDPDHICNILPVMDLGSYRKLIANFMGNEGYLPEIYWDYSSIWFERVHYKSDRTTSEESGCVAAEFAIVQLAELDRLYPELLKLLQDEKITIDAFKKIIKTHFNCRSGDELKRGVKAPEIDEIPMVWFKKQYEEAHSWLIIQIELGVANAEEIFALSVANLTKYGNEFNTECHGDNIPPLVRFKMKHPDSYKMMMDSIDPLDLMEFSHSFLASHQEGMKAALAAPVKLDATSPQWQKLITAARTEKDLVPVHALRRAQDKFEGYAAKVEAAAEAQKRAKLASAREKNRTGELQTTQR